MPKHVPNFVSLKELYKRSPEEQPALFRLDVFRGKNIPSDSMAVGNPCKVIRKIMDEDKQELQMK